MAGTGAEYAHSDGPLFEGITPLAPTTLYGACKAALHISSSAYFAERGVSSGWGHIFYLYGPRENPGRLVPSVIRAMSRGETFTCDHPDDVRDFLHVDDVAGAFVAFLGSEVQGAVNIASGERISVGDLVAGIATSMGRPDLILRETVSDTVSATVGDSTRLRREVGCEPLWTLEQGIDATIEWWKPKLGDAT